MPVPCGLTWRNDAGHVTGTHTAVLLSRSSSFVHQPWIVSAVEIAELTREAASPFRVWEPRKDGHADHNVQSDSRRLAQCVFRVGRS
jgi:hypothetical protein